VEVPQVRFTEAPKLTQRLQFVENTKKQSWQDAKRWPLLFKKISNLT
jgi:hypothetical protein